MRQVPGAGTLGRPRGMGWRGRWEGGSGWGTHVNPWLIHVNVWQKLLQYCKVITLQLIKKKKGSPLRLWGSGVVASVLRRGWRAQALCVHPPRLDSEAPVWWEAHPALLSTCRSACPASCPPAGPSSRWSYRRSQSLLRAQRSPHRSSFTPDQFP